MKGVFRLLILLIVLPFGWVRASNSDELRTDLLKRRELISAEIGADAMLILFSASPKNKTGDVDYEYRQDNNLFYLTGIPQSETTLVLMPGNVKRKALIFVKDRNPASEHWEGKILSHDEVKNISGIEHVYSAEAFPSFIDSIFNGNPFRVERYSADPEYSDFFQKLQAGQAIVYFSFPEQASLNKDLSTAHKFAASLRERFYGFTVRDAARLFQQRRQVKSDFEIRMLREAIRITEDGILEMMNSVSPGKWEYEMESIIEGVYKKNNAYDWGFPSIVASGPNATILHYESNQRQLQRGDLILMDLGAEFRFYTADITRTFPVDGKFSPAQKDIYAIVLEAQQAAMNMIRPGILLPDVHKKAVEIVKNGLLKLGLITDATGDQYRMYFTHGTSHWLGMDVHDVGNRSRALEPGMVFTVEPGIYVQPDLLENLPHSVENEKLTAKIKPSFEKYKGIGVRIEDDVLVTQDGFEHLSNRVPRTIEQIEAHFTKHKP